MFARPTSKIGPNGWAVLQIGEGLTLLYQTGTRARIIPGPHWPAVLLSEGDAPKCRTADLLQAHKDCCYSNPLTGPQGLLPTPARLAEIYESMCKSSRRTPSFERPSPQEKHQQAKKFETGKVGLRLHCNASYLGSRTHVQVIRSPHLPLV